MAFARGASRRTINFKLAALTGKGEWRTMEAILADLLHMDGRRKRQTKPQLKSVDAQILLFTGVRYERGSPTPETNIDAKRRKRKRG
jgi:hypothetical protein